ncbi:molybdate ABC transporter substrate-binding protein [Celerinatantimonas sp. YJH-8]|uniref:molybdate ABC transporter substrate-binding protein n=1 Tax=Celerinatantimonas sp. YJH-8 TaxID=3228714 RepID=UPI0038C108FA
MKKLVLVAAILGAFVATGANAAEVTVAVAANFYKPLQSLASAYEKTHSDTVKLSVGSTGKLYAQIVNGAPFDIFLAADQRRPQKLMKDKQAVAGSEFTYAKGRLIFWSKEANLIQGDAYLKKGAFDKLAIANPKAAPYGAASIETMKNLKVYASLKDKIVFGQNIGQTYSYVSYGNVKQGFVALSQVYRDGKLTSGSGWIVPGNLYHSIRQDAVLLKDNAPAKAFLNYLQTPEAQAIIRSYGYDI